MKNTKFITKDFQEFINSIKVFTTDYYSIFYR